VRAYRTCAARKRAALLVHIDADTGSTERRHKRLAETLEQSSQAARGAQESIAILVPRRNIETWIHFLLHGAPVDETVEYPKFPKRESEAWPAAEKFDEASRGESLAGAPPSLVLALDEMLRIPEELRSIVRWCSARQVSGNNHMPFRQ
jgi:hypothetical protein